MIPSPSSLYVLIYCDPHSLYFLLFQFHPSVPSATFWRNSTEEKEEVQQTVVEGGSGLTIKDMKFVV